MRRVKPVLCALLALCLACLCACSQRPEQSLAAAQKKLAEVGSLSYTVDMDMCLSAEGWSNEIKTTSRISVTSEPAAVHIECVTGTDDMILSEYSAYAVSAGGLYSAYIKFNDTWKRQDLSGVEELASYDLRSNIALWTSGLSSVTVGDSEEIDGRQATRYDCVVGAEGVDAIMNGTGAYTALPVLGLSHERSMEVLSGLGELTYSVWIDNKLGLPLRYDIDMTDIMDQFLKNITANIPTAVTMDSLTVSLNLSDFDAVEPIVVPPEALGARPLDGEGIF